MGWLNILGFFFFFVIQIATCHTETHAHCLDNEHHDDEKVEEKNETAITSSVIKKTKKNCIKKSESFCCIAKEYFDEYAGLVDSLQIVPRVIVYKHKLRKKSKYGLSISLKNNALFPRYVHFFTDSPIDTTIKVCNAENHRYIQPDETLELNVVIQAAKAKNINRRRNIYIESVHPNIVFEVPIIILDQLKVPQVSNQIIFPSCTQRNKTHYELVIYNPTKESIKLKVASSFRYIKISAQNKLTIPKRDYIKMLFTLTPKELKVLNGTISVKFGTQQPFQIRFDFTPRLVSVHVSAGSIEFRAVKFGEELKRTVTICNEGSTDISVDVEFLTENNGNTSIGNISEQSNRRDLEEKFIDADVQSMHSVLAYDFDQVNTPKEREIYDPMAYKHFQINNPETLKAYSSEEATLVFHPIYDLDNPFEENLDPPYLLRTKLFFAFTDGNECTQSNWIIISGLIDGLEIEVHPKIIDFRKIYLGEEHCTYIRVLNIDGRLNTNVKFKEFNSPKVAGVTISPLSIDSISPCMHGNFHLSFFSRKPSKFSVTLHFKVTNGGTYKVIVKGHGLHVELRTFPTLVEFGTIPIAVPQKRYLLLMNPLSVPITLQVSPSDDGEEQPLVLNIKDNTDLMPITIKDPIMQLQQVNNDLRSEAYDQVEIELNDLIPEKESFGSYDTSDSIYSVVFEEDVMEPIPTMALQLITALKKQKIFDKSETDKRVVQEAMTYLLNTKYFSTFIKHSNFAFMDWNAIPSNPKEVYCDSEIIYLRPNTGKSITILIIPNSVGYFHRSLTVRVCPQSIANFDESQNDKCTSLINSEFLCSKLWFEYNCCIPDIEWLNIVNLTQRQIYAGEDYDFDMEFWNNSSVGGFIHFDVVVSTITVLLNYCDFIIPNVKQPSEMTFRESIWKFYIGPDEEIVAKCCVCFQTIGPTKLWGLLKIVGSHHSYPFHITAKVFPTNINVTPKFIRQRLQVLEISKVNFYIDNATPTSTMLLMRLKNEDNQYLTCRGGILAPFGQSIYTTLVSKFSDPDMYTNILYIDLQFENVVEVQITFVVEGVPIFFEPNIKEGFDAGIIFTSSKENFQSNFSHYCEIVKVINRGKRAYRLNITRLRNLVAPINGTKQSTCTAAAMVARFDMMPKSFYLEPDSCDYLTLTAGAYEECIITSEFRIEVIDQKYPQRTYTMRIPMTAIFMHCNLMWGKKKITFNFKHTHNFNNHPYIETCALINPHRMSVENVLLEVSGPFRIKELFEHNFEKIMYIRLEPFEQKDIFIILNKAPLKELFCKTLDGRINAIAYGKIQKSLPLKVSVLVPEVVISSPEVVFFTRGKEYYRYIEVMNVGCLLVEFKWKRLEITQHYIGMVDNSREFISDILSEIIRMVDYELDDDEESNLTLRYRKYKCRYQFESETRNDIMDILDEIINNLDLTHKRYILHLSTSDYEPGNDKHSEKEEECDEQSSGTIVRETISEILEKLKLESSFVSSPVSSDHCFFERSIYFCEKTGVLYPGQTGKCMLHIPYLKRSYESIAIFQLNINGGQSQMLKVTVVNLAQKIKFSNDNIYLYIKPWYEMCQSKIRVFNTTKYRLQLKIDQEKEALKNDKSLSGGYAKLISSNSIELEPMASDVIQIECVLGFSENFYRLFLIDISDHTESSFCLRGQGIMPILSMSSNLNAIEQNPFDIAEEYRLLQQIYYYEMFNGITVVDKEPKIAPHEEEYTLEDRELLTEYETISETTEDSERKKIQEIKFFKLLQSYLLVNNNEELPNAIVMKQLLETAKYLKRLRANSDLYKMQLKVYQAYLKTKKSFDDKMPINLKHFAVQSIPCELHGNVLELGTLKINTFKRFSFTLHFFGPGKLIASARTIVKIPGLYVDFKVDKHSDKHFLYWAEKCKSPEFFNSKYRNMFERLLDAQIDPKLNHAHSFDIDDRIKHQRDITSKNRRNIDNYYNSLNMSVYADHKHHFTLCKIYTKYHSNFSGIDLSVVGLLKPISKFYTDGQSLEDYIYIDLHMGPTLPILLRGLIAQ